MIEKLHHSSRKSLARADLRRKKLLFKTNKTRNTTSKTTTRVEEMMDTDQRRHILEEMGGIAPWRVDGIGWSCCIWLKNI
jgi:hypothetical protein